MNTSAGEPRLGRRILLLVPSMAAKGGTERMVHSLSVLLREAGYDVSQATFDAPETPAAFDSGVKRRFLGPIPRLPLALRPWAYLTTVRRLVALKRELNVDVTISNLWGADLISALAGGRDRKIALGHINVIGNPTNRLMVRFRPAVALVYRRFDRVIAVSEPLARELRELYRLHPARVDYINNFVDPPEARSCLPEDGVQRFVWCGRLVVEKNVEGLLALWANFCQRRSDMQLVLLGDGPLRSSLLELAGELGLRTGNMVEGSAAQVVFMGSVPHPADYMLGARALLLTSHAEGLPMVMLEAMALGLPILASDCPAGGVRTALQGHGRCEPERFTAEWTEVGALLPVPRAAVPASLVPWDAALTTLCEDSAQWAAWHRGALDRSRLFSSAVAREKWERVLEELSA